MIGIDLVLIRLIFKSRKRKSKKRKNKFSKRRIKFYLINNQRRRNRLNSMRSTLNRLTFRSKKTSLLNLPMERKTGEKKRKLKSTISKKCSSKSFRRKKEENKKRFKRKESKTISQLGSFRKILSNNNSKKKEKSRKRKRKCTRFILKTKRKRNLNRIWRKRKNRKKLICKDWLLKYKRIRINRGPSKLGSSKKRSTLFSNREKKFSRSKRTKMRKEKRTMLSTSSGRIRSSLKEKRGLKNRLRIIS